MIPNTGSQATAYSSLDLALSQAQAVKTTSLALLATFTWLPPGFEPVGQSMVGPEELLTVIRWPLNGSPKTVLRSYQTWAPSKL